MRPIPSFLFVSTALFPDIGGPAGYVDRMARAAHDAGYRVRVIAYGANDASLRPFPVSRLPRLPFPFKESLLFFRMIISGFSYSVWYAHGGVPVTLPALIAAQMLRKRFVIKVTGDYAWERARNSGLTEDSIDDFQVRTYGFRISLARALRSFVVRHADLVVVPSDYLRRMAEGWGVSPSRISVIHNAVPSLAASSSFSRDPMLVVSAGRFVSWKGFDGLIRAFVSLAGAFPAARLAIAGDGPDRSRLIREAGSSSRISFLGTLSPSAMRDLYCRAGVFVLFSSYEGMPHVLLEALACGAPVIASDAGGNPELISPGENGILVPSGDVSALRFALSDFLRSGARSLSRPGFADPSRYSEYALISRTLAALTGDPLPSS